MPSSLLCTCFFCIWHWLDWIYIPNITEQSNSVATEFALSISCASRVRKIGRPWNSSRPQDIGALWLRSVESRCSTNKKIGREQRKWCSFSRICLFIPMILSECFHVFYGGVQWKYTLISLLRQAGQPQLGIQTFQHDTSHDLLSVSAAPKKKRFKEKKDPVQVLVENLATKKKQKHHKMLYKTCTESCLVVPRQHGSGHDGCK